MAAETKRQTVDLIRLIQKNPGKFSLGQAMRLFALEKAQDPASPSLRVRSWLSLAFPSIDIEAVDKVRGAYHITATKGGLYSTLGPLPTFYTEELLDEARNDSSIARDFLDIITDRLVKLDTGAAQHARLSQRHLEQDDNAAQHVLCALSGSTDIPALKITHTAALPLLVGNKRTAEGLALYLKLRTGLADISIEQCTMSNVHIRPEQRCLLGKQCTVLGNDTVIGSLVPDINKKIRIHAHQLSSEEIGDCITGGKTHRLLCTAVREYLMSPLDFDIILHPKAEAAQAQRLGITAHIGAYLPSEKPLQPVCIFSKEEYAA